MSVNYKPNDVYRAAHGIGQAQAAGPLPQSFSRVALVAMSMMPGVSKGEMMGHFWRGVSDYYDMQDARDAIEVES